MEEDEMTYGIDRLAELLAERGIEFCVGDRTSLVFMDGVGNLHECWMAGAEENLVNVCITITPEQALSVRDLNGIVSENAKLREHVRWLKKGDVLHVLTDQELADQLKHEREMRASITALDDENAKLRELMHDMLRWMPCPTHCYHCERYHYPEGCEFEIRRRELGIEVD